MTADSAACFFSVPTVAASSPPESIATLTAALAAGNEAAFCRFYRAYAGRLLRYALAITHGDFALSEEAVQLALIRIASKVRRFPDENAFWAWLARVVRSCAIDCARRHSRYGALLGRLRDELACDPLPDEVDRAFFDQLQVALATLLPADRELLAAKYEQGQSTASLAELADCSPKAMESRLARLRERVRDAVLARLSHDP
jgi:RNA polymerase sigma factor (sigma-70 family)